MKTITNIIYLAFALFAFACFTLLPAPQAFGVVPPPDGGYPNFTTAEGTNALQNLTSGLGNTATGWHSLFANTAGNLNTAVGAGTLLLNTGDNNTATGALALLSNTGGFHSTADGAFALFSNTTGSGNTATGYQALFSNQTGSNNAAYGYTALYNNTTSFNTALGSQTLVYNTTGFHNTATGYQALAFNTIGDNNTATGTYALNQNTQGYGNTACGYGALEANTVGYYNTIVGFQAGLVTTGTFNIAIGAGAGNVLTTGSYNIDIDNHGVAGESGTIRMGNNQFHTATYLAGIAGQTVGAGGSTCYVDNDGKLGVFLSARRFKTDIADMNSASEAILRLRPVTFRYKPEMKATDAQQFGLIAEEVAEVNPNLVTRDGKGELSTVRYEAVNAMLLNEFLKEHCKNEEQGATIAQQQKEIEALKAELKEQASQIQKVSAQLELTKPAPQTALNDQ
jgi:hypothetical protein